MKLSAHLDAATRKRIRAELRSLGRLLQLVRDHPKPPNAPVQPKPRSTNGPVSVAQPPDPTQDH